MRGATCCSDGLGLNYTLPMGRVCKKEALPNGTMVQTYPKLIPLGPDVDTSCIRKSKLGIPPGQRICRFLDCLSNPCATGWCEETMTGFECHDDDSPESSTGKNVATLTTLQTKSYDDQPSTAPTTPATSMATSPEGSSESPTTAPTIPATSMTTTPEGSSEPPITAPTTPSTSMATTAEGSSEPPTTASTTPATSTATTQEGSSCDSSNISGESPATDVVFIADKDGHKIWMAKVTDMNFTVFLNLSQQSLPNYVTFHSRDQEVYWSDKGDNRIWGAGLVNRTPEAVSNGDNPVYNAISGIAIAESRGMIYCAYSSWSGITSIRLGEPDSEANFIAIAGLGASALVVDEVRGFLYGTSGSEIYRAPLGGSTSGEKIYQNSHLAVLTGLSIDPTGGRLFLCDITGGNAFYVDVDDTNINSVDLTSGFQYGTKLYDVSFFNGTAYWTQTNPGTRGIYELKKTGCIATFHDISSGIISPRGIHVGQINSTLIGHLFPTP